MNKITLFIISFLLALSTAAQVSHRKCGAYLHTESTRLSSRTTFSCQLVPGKSSFPILQFQQQQTVVWQDVQIHQVEEEVIIKNNGEGITTQGNVQTKIVPGAVMEAGKQTREVEEDPVPLANAKILMNGKKIIVTDAKGQWYDTQQTLLGMFDDMYPGERIINLKLPDGSVLEKHLTCKILIAPTPNAADAPDMKDDLAATLGCDFTRLNQSSHSKLKVSLEFAEKAAPGEFVQATITVQNDGTEPVSNLLACTFSSSPSLDGKLFYFGKILPGHKALFTRILQMPDIHGTIFTTFAFSDLLDSIPELALQRSTLLEK